MVLIKLDSFNYLIELLQRVPHGFPKRSAVIKREWNQFESCLDFEISVEVAPILSRVVERNILQESDERKEKILDDLISQFANVNLNRREERKTPLFLLSPQETCDCGAGLRVIAPKTRNVTVFTSQGAVEALAYTKHCGKCSGKFYPAYKEFQTEDGSTFRSYSNTDRFVSTTQDSYFETSFLDMVREDLFLLDSKFSLIAEKYNNLQKTGGKELNYKRLELCFIVYEINKRVPGIKYPVIRKSQTSELDQEAVCQFAFPMVAAAFHEKWISHLCDNCSSRAIIMDGDCKLFRLESYRFSRILF